MTKKLFIISLLLLGYFPLLAVLRFTPRSVAQTTDWNAPSTLTTETYILSAGPIDNPSVNQSVSASKTFSDGPNRLLHSIKISGVGDFVSADDVLFIHGNTNGGPDWPIFNSLGGTDGIITTCNGITSPATLPQRKGCSGRINVKHGSGVYFTDSGNPSVDTVTISGTAYDTWAPRSGANSVGFSGVQIDVTWQNCNAGEHTENGKCVPSGGTITVSSKNSVTGDPVPSKWQFTAFPSTDPCPSLADCSGTSVTYPSMPAGSYTLNVSPDAAGSMFALSASSISGDCPGVNPCPLNLSAGSTINYNIPWNPVAILSVTTNSPCCNLSGAETSGSGSIANTGDSTSRFRVGCIVEETDLRSIQWLTLTSCPDPTDEFSGGGPSRPFSFIVDHKKIEVAGQSAPVTVHGQIIITASAVSLSQVQPPNPVTVDISYSLPPAPAVSFTANNSHQTTIASSPGDNIRYSWSSTSGSTYSVYLDVLDALGNHTTDPLGNKSRFICQDVGPSDTCKDNFNPVSGGTASYVLDRKQAGYTYKWSYFAKNAIGTTAIDWVAIKVAALLTPTASLTITPSSVIIPDNVTYVWSSTGGTSFSWALDVSGGSDAPCGNVSTNNWTSLPQTASGNQTFPTADCQKGHTYTVTYTVTNSVGSVSKSASVTVAAPPSGGGACTSGSGWKINGSHSGTCCAGDTIQSNFCNDKYTCENKSFTCPSTTACQLACNPHDCNPYSCNPYECKIRVCDKSDPIIGICTSFRDASGVCYKRCYQTCYDVCPPAQVSYQSCDVCRPPLTAESSASAVSVKTNPPATSEAVTFTANGGGGNDGTPSGGTPTYTWVTFPSNCWFLNGSTYLPLSTISINPATIGCDHPLNTYTIRVSDDGGSYGQVASCTLGVTGNNTAPVASPAQPNPITCALGDNGRPCQNNNSTYVSGIDRGGLKLTALVYDPDIVSDKLGDAVVQKCINIGDCRRSSCAWDIYSNSALVKTLKTDVNIQTSDLTCQRVGNTVASSFSWKQFGNYTARFTFDDGYLNSPTLPPSRIPIIHLPDQKFVIYPSVKETVSDAVKTSDWFKDINNLADVFGIFVNATQKIQKSALP